MGQAGRGGRIHHRYLQPCSTGTRAPLRGVCKYKCPRKSYRQGHPAVSDKWSGLPAHPAQCTRGVLEPHRGQEGQDD